MAVSVLRHGYIGYVTQKDIGTTMYFELPEIVDITNNDEFVYLQEKKGILEENNDEKTGGCVACV